MPFPACSPRAVPPFRWHCQNNGFDRRVFVGFFILSVRPALTFAFGGGEAGGIGHDDSARDPLRPSSARRQLLQSADDNKCLLQKFWEVQQDFDDLNFIANLALTKLPFSQFWGCEGWLDCKDDWIGFAHLSQNELFDHALSSNSAFEAPESGKGLERKLLQESPPRSQDPEHPLPYSAINVTFPSFVGGDVTLAGTLTLPNTPPPHPAVLLISGSGPTQRDAEFLGHKWFLVLADHLTRKGIAVLRYDDRGVGESTGNHSTATTYDLADDAIGGVRYLKTREDIDLASVGMLGHSEGGIIAPVAVSKIKDTGRTRWMPDFLVLAAPPALKWEVINEMVVKQMGEDAGFSPEEMKTLLQNKKQIIELIKGSDGASDVADEIKGLLTELETSFGRILNIGGANMSVEGQLAYMSTPWYKVFLTLDPVTFFKRVDVPTLVLLGSNDVQVSPEFHEDQIRNGFSSNANTNITVVDGANHMFQLSDTKLISEIPKINETIAPVVLDMISSWILARSSESD